MTLQSINEAIQAAFDETIENADVFENHITFDEYDIECLRLLILDKIKIRGMYP